MFIKNMLWFVCSIPQREHPEDDQGPGRGHLDLTTITRLADCVKLGAASLGAEQPEAQVGAGAGNEGGRGVDGRWQKGSKQHQYWVVEWLSNMGHTTMDWTGRMETVSW